MPGDLVVFSSLVVHSSGANRAETARRAFYVNYSRRQILWTQADRDMLVSRDVQALSAALDEDWLKREHTHPPKRKRDEATQEVLLHGIGGGGGGGGSEHGRDSSRESGKAGSCNSLHADHGNELPAAGACPLWFSVPCYEGTGSDPVTELLAPY